jgi:hypothetical protein
MIKALPRNNMQNGFRITYYLEPFCPLSKGILLLVRERVFRWNPLYNNLPGIANRLSELGLVYSNGAVKYLVEEESDSHS